jgi:hypothetical protein
MRQNPVREKQAIMNVQCPACGKTQEYDPQYTICLHCGGPLQESDSLILKNPRRGRGMEATGILFFIGFLAVFLFYSKFAGRHGMAISALVWIWGFYKAYRNRRDASAQNEHPGKPPADPA